MDEIILVLEAVKVTVFVVDLTVSVYYLLCAS